MIQKIKENLRWQHLVGIGLGAVGGYGYWYFYGCVNGCTITGSALNSTVYFAIMGYMAAGLLPQKPKPTEE